MSTHINRGRGKLYEADGETFVANISYRVYEELAMEPILKRWSGELVFVEYVKIRDGASYIIELEDKRKGRCFVKRRTNRAVIGVPSRFFYLFQGGGLLK